MNQKDFNIGDKVLYRLKTQHTSNSDRPQERLIPGVVVGYKGEISLLVKLNNGTKTAIKSCVCDNVILDS